MTPHWQDLNTWHLDLSIVADAIEHVLREVEDPPGLSAIAHVLKTRLQDLVESCPFPDSLRLSPVAMPDFDLSDFDGSLSVDVEGVPAELLTGGRDD